MTIIRGVTNMKLLSNEKGIALPLVIVFLVVFSILGVALLNIALAETKVTIYEQKRMQAYYIAKSAAESVARELTQNSESTLLKSIEDNPTTVIKSINNSLEGGKYDIDIIRDENKIRIEAVGHYKDTTAKAVLVLSDLHDMSVVSVGLLDLRGIANLSGPVESTNSNVIYEDNKPITWDLRGEYEEYTYRFLPPVSVPDLPYYDPATNPTPGTQPKEFIVNTSPIPSGYEYAYIDVPNTKTLKFDTTDGNVIIVTGYIDCKGDFEIIGPNQVFLFLKQGGITSQLKTRNAEGNHDPDQLFIFLNNNSKLEISTGSRTFNGHIYGPNAKITLWAGAELRGTVVGEIFSTGGNPSLYHEPVLNTPTGFSQYISGYTRYRKLYWEQ